MKPDYLALVARDYGMIDAVPLNKYNVVPYFTQAKTRGVIKCIVDRATLQYDTVVDPLAQNCMRLGDAMLIRFEVVPLKEHTETRTEIVGWEVAE